MDTTGQLSPENVLEGRYVIIRTVGQGGMGAVYQALDMRLHNMPVAIKKMNTGSTGGDLESAIAAFKKEALMLINLKHPALPIIRDFFSQGEERWYLVMDYIEGNTLADIARIRGTIPQEEVFDWGSQLCEILDYLHKQDPPVVFRDLKPANIMLTPEGLIKLIDFGIARHFKLESTQDTVCFGSAGYAPPEQYGNNQTDSTSDIYALGATLHFLLTGVNPSINPFKFIPPGTIVDVSPALEKAIMMALELQPEKRPASAWEMLRIMRGTTSLEDIADTVLIKLDNQTEFITTTTIGLKTQPIDSNPNHLSESQPVPTIQNKAAGWKQWLMVFAGILLLTSFGFIIFYSENHFNSYQSDAKVGISKNMDSEPEPTQNSATRTTAQNPGMLQNQNTDNSLLETSTATGNVATLMVDSNGAKWEWIEGDLDLRTGKVKITWINGDLYKGDVVQGIIDGNGEYTTANQQHYVGQFADNTMNGVGTLTSKEGTWTGTFNDGMLEYGHFEANDQLLVYDGQFKDFSFHGQGTVIFLEDGSKYEGEFNEGVKNGWGTYTYADGTKLSGEWRNDKLVSN